MKTKAEKPFLKKESLGKETKILQGKEYNKFRWILDSINPQTNFAKFIGSMNKSKLNENKIINTHNKDLENAIKSTQKRAKKEFLELIKWVERKRITDNNDYISISIKVWNKFKSAVEGRK